MDEKEHTISGSELDSEHEDVLFVKGPYLPKHNGFSGGIHVLCIQPSVELSGLTQAEIDAIGEGEV